MSQLPYFSPFYFSPFYFGTLAPSMPDDGDSTAPAEFNEGEAFADLAGRLAATGEFSAVFFGPGGDRNPYGPGSYPFATITPLGSEDSDDFDPTSVLRRVEFEITICVADESPRERYEQLMRLSKRARVCVHEANLGGGCIPPLTCVFKEKFGDRSKHPEQSVSLKGRFAYLVDFSSAAPLPL